MKRREFIALLGGMTIGSQSSVRAQQVYRIGYLSLGSPTQEDTRFDAFREGLKALGYVEGKNLVIEARWLNGATYEQLPPLAKQLSDLRVAVIVTYSTPGVLAAKRATAEIPIVFLTAGDAVASGLVASLARPGGQVTGISYFNPELASKRLEFLKEALPGLNHSGILLNDNNPATKPVVAAVRSTARSLKLELSEFAVRAPADQDAAFAAMAAKPVGGFIITEDPMLIYDTASSAKLAQQYRLPGCGFTEFAEAGGFAAYGIDFPEMWRHGATLVDKILKGADPADLPVEQATRFVTVVNTKTAKAIGVEVPTSLLLRADIVIE
jgi:putative ABC transport system substrate-binding protein